jgi:transposase
MIPVPSGVRVWLAVGRTDMRRGMNGLALQVQEALQRDPHAGDLYVFRGARGNLITGAVCTDGKTYQHGKRTAHLGSPMPQGITTMKSVSFPVSVLNS